MERLRIALVEAYVSILFGLQEEAQQVSAVDVPQMKDSFSKQMFQYLEAMVEDKTLSFPPDLLRPMYELYIDIATIYLNNVDEQTIRS